MIQRRLEEFLPGQRPRAGARTCSPHRSENVRVPTRPAHMAGGIGFCWLILAAEMAGPVYGDRRPAPDAVRMPLIAVRTMGADAGSVRAARDFTIATLRRWGTAERAQDVAIVVSELLTNALRHALPEQADTLSRWPIRLGLLRHGSGVLCAVADPGRAVPVPQVPEPLTENGRGLQMVSALCDRWGYTTPGDAGKVVWAAFDGTA